MKTKSVYNLVLSVELGKLEKLDKYYISSCICYSFICINQILLFHQFFSKFDYCNCSLSDKNNDIHVLGQYFAFLVTCPLSPSPSYEPISSFQYLFLSKTFKYQSPWLLRIKLGYMYSFEESVEDI